MIAVSKNAQTSGTTKALALGLLLSATLVTLSLAYKNKIFQQVHNDSLLDSAEDLLKKCHLQNGVKETQEDCYDEKNSSPIKDNGQESATGVPDNLIPSTESRSKITQLPVITSSYNPNDANLLKMSERIFFYPDELSGNHSISDFGLMGLAAKAQSMVYNEMYIHRYDEFNDLKLASGPQVDQEKCLNHLENLVERAKRLRLDKYQSKDINIYQLLDTFGQKASGLLVGNVFLEGMYNECLRLKIRVSNGHETIATKYCVVGVKHLNWPQLDRYDLLDFKMGACLPKTCDSQNYKNKYDLIYQLVESQVTDIELNQFKLNNIYCLPDDDSPLRSVGRSRIASLTLAAICAWISLLIYATYRHQKLQAKAKAALEVSEKVSRDETYTGGLTSQRRERARAAWAEASKNSSFGLSNGLSLSQEDNVASRTSLINKFFGLLSITNNLSQLFDTSKESSLVGATASTSETNISSDRPTQHYRRPSTVASKSYVDLRCLEGIKVIAMCYVIMGHVLMCHTSLLANGREVASSTSISFHMANLVPAFAVNSFFTVTGILTTYLMFKQNQNNSFISSPAKWIALIVYRYLRIMPMYALVVLYTKTLAKYTGSGPLWDYGTSALGQRKVCEQEPWSWTLMFASNFLRPLDHCIPAGWSPEFGQRLIQFCIVAGYMAGFWSIFKHDEIDTTPIAKFAPNGFKTYIAQFSFNYTQPQYRIPAYLIGILIGYKLYCFERDKIKFAAAQQNRAHIQETIQEGQEKQFEEEQILLEPDWSEAFKKYAILVSLTIVMACCVTPMIGAQLPFNRQWARFMVSLITPSYHVVFALAVGTYILLATTGHANKTLTSFLAAPVWKPFARLSLCAVLINVEVINFLVQTNSNMHYVNNQYHIALNMLCIVATYLVSIIVCVLFESPMRGTLNTMLVVAMSRYAAKATTNKPEQANHQKVA